MKKKASVGILRAKDTGKFLLLLRPDDGTILSETWTFVAGSIDDDDDDPLDTIKREIEEELVFNSSEIKFKYLGKLEHEDIDLYYFLCNIESEEMPIINEENLNWGWFEINNLPKNTFPETIQILEKLQSDGFFG
jgi:8-oxo-dGTP pyrophosphatase MutT (NUDIX family)